MYLHIDRILSTPIKIFKYVQIKKKKTTLVTNCIIDLHRYILPFKPNTYFKWFKKIKVPIGENSQALVKDREYITYIYFKIINTY